MSTTKKWALCALMTALALVLSYAESFLPVQLLVPIPGLKLGLANLVTLAALYLLGLPYAAAIALARCTLGAFYASGVTSLWFSLCGAALSIVVMEGLRRHFPRTVSLWGVSVAGAAAHNTGQIIAAAIAMRTGAIFAYLPVLLVASIVTGAVIAAVAMPLLRLLSHVPIEK